MDCSANGPLSETLPIKEAGDMIDFHRWNLRRYAADSAAGAALGPAEDILTTDSCHSIVPATLASFNLSKAYTTLGNFPAASLSAMLHLSLVIIQDDAEAHQRAVLNVLRVFSETVATDPARFQNRLAGLSKHWRAFLNDSTMHRWYETGGRCDEVERFIEGCMLSAAALWSSRAYAAERDSRSPSRGGGESPGSKRRSGL